MEHVIRYFSQMVEIAQLIDKAAVEALAIELKGLRDRGGRLFVLGVGGSAANAGHAVNDFRKLCSIEAYAPTDNVAELTARTNDEGWESVFVEWLRISRLGPDDGLLIYSVGGGDKQRNLSVNLIHAIDLARKHGARVFGVVGRPDGYTAGMADVAVIVPVGDEALVTPLSETFQAVVWHCLVSHPDLMTRKATW